MMMTPEQKIEEDAFLIAVTGIALTVQDRIRNGTLHGIPTHMIQVLLEALRICMSRMADADLIDIQAGSRRSAELILNEMQPGDNNGDKETKH